MSKYKFKVGDLIIVNGRADGQVFINEIGRIVVGLEDGSRCAGIEFNKGRGIFHSCGGSGKQDYCWNISVDIIKSYLTKLKLKKLLNLS